MVIRRLLTLALVSTLALFAHEAHAQPTDNDSPAASIPNPALGAQSIIGSGTISSTDTPTMTDRLFRDGSASTCAAPKAYPGTFPGAGYAYDTLSFTNDGPSRCVTLRIDATCSGGDNAFGAFLSAYRGSFDPMNLATNYLGDTGTSVGAPDGRSQTMILRLSQGQTITLVVNQVNDSATDPPSACSYEVSEQDAVAPAPAIAPLGLALSVLGLAGLGLGAIRRRR